jgi:hypothetical protein
MTISTWNSSWVYEVQYSFDGVNWQNGMSFSIHQNITVQLKHNYTGDPTQDLSLEGDTVSVGDEDPTMTQSLAAFIVGSGHVNLESNVNLKEE